MADKDKPKTEQQRQPVAGSLISSMLSGSTAGAQPTSEEAARFMYRGAMGENGDKSLTLRTRLIRQDMNGIHRAIIADRTLRYPGRRFRGLEEAAFLMMELLVSEDGKGRQEYVQMLQSRTTANIDLHETPHRDASLEP